VGRTGAPEAVACVLVAPRSLKRLPMGEDDSAFGMAQPRLVGVAYDSRTGGEGSCASLHGYGPHHIHRGACVYEVFFGTF
jgi:hypothetical protein